jgi:hydrogenase maturation protease
MQVEMNPETRPETLPPPGARGDLPMEADPGSSCLVLGVGNSLLQDDGFGSHVAQALMERRLSGMHVLDGGTIGLALLPEVERVDALVLVDAAELGEPPGTVRVFIDREIDAHLSGKRRSVHEVAILDLLAAAELRGCRPRHCALVAVQPACTDWGVEPTPPVRHAIPQACTAIERLTEDWRHES